MKRLILLFWLFAAACTDEPASEEPEQQPVLDEREIRPNASPNTLPPMPAFPEPRSGVLNATSTGPHSIDGAWQAQAGLCEDPGTIQVLAEVPGTGTLVLMQLAEGDRIGTYPITIADSGMPTPPAAQVGVQLFRDAESFAFQATDGEVEIYGYGVNVSGRFAVTLREIQSNTLVQYAGVFAGVPVEHLSAEYCERMKTAMREARPAVGVH